MLSSSVACFIVVVVCDAHLPYGEEEQEIRKKLGLYKNLEEVLDILRKDVNPIAHQIVKNFQTECLYTEEPVLPDGNRKPFIVVEGNHRSSKDAIGQKLASLMDGRYLSQMAPCLRRFFYRIRGKHPLRHALQFLSLYASAFDARVQMALNRAVVINGYWTEQLYFSLTKSFHAGEIPSIFADLMKYPEDLMQPDIHIFLYFGETLYTTPATPRFYEITNVRQRNTLKKRKLELYRYLQSQLPILIHDLQRVSNRVTADQLLSQVRSNLSGTRDFDRRIVSDDYGEA